MVARALVTGASGFIGQALVKGLVAAGWTVTSAGRHPSSVGPEVTHIDWSLGSALVANLADIDTLFHCACATISATSDVEVAMRLDVSGTELLVRQCRVVSQERSKPLQFVFMSSQSSTPQAINTYGRSKYAIEQSLTGPDEVIVRPGLVYDATRTGVYGTAVRLIESMRVIPKFATAPCIQPIHVEDLVNCLRRVGKLRPSGTLCLGAEAPLDFVAFCRRVAARESIPTPLFVPGTGPIIQYLLDFAARAHLCANLNERVKGLTALQPMETGASLARIGVRLRDF
jgi:nucleoside-diphosphate-sugar epimerase